MRSIITVIVGLLLWAASAQAATISVDPFEAAAYSGNTFYVNIVGGDNFPETQGGGVNLVFDPGILNAVSVSIDGLIWNFVNDPGTIDNGTGRIDDILVSALNESGSDPVGSFVVATIGFKAVGAGATTLTLTESAINPWASFENLVNPLFVEGSITVAVIPEPNSLFLFGSGLAGLLGFRKIVKHVS